MTTKQQQLRSHLNLTIEGDEELNDIFARCDAEALRARWSDDAIREFAAETSMSRDLDESWAQKGITLRDQVIAEMQD